MGSRCLRACFKRLAHSAPNSFTSDLESSDEEAATTVRDVTRVMLQPIRRSNRTLLATKKVRKVNSNANAFTATPNNGLDWLLGFILMGNEGTAEWWSFNKRILAWLNAAECHSRVSQVSIACVMVQLPRTTSRMTRPAWKKVAVAATIATPKIALSALVKAGRLEFGSLLIRGELAADFDRFNERILAWQYVAQERGTS